MLKYEQTPAGLWVPADHVPEPKPTAVDLFAGAGGFSLGMIDAGFEIACAVENEPYSAMTYLTNLGSMDTRMLFVEDEDRKRFRRAVAWVEKNQADALGPDGRWTAGSNRGRLPKAPPVRSFILGDVRKVSGATISDITGLEPGEIDVVVGGPPCQGFSTANSNRNADDPRNTLIFEMARLIVELQPRSFALENVPGILNMRTSEGLSVIVQFEQILRRGGYDAYNALSRWKAEHPTAETGGPKQPPKDMHRKDESGQGNLLASL